MVNRDTSSEVGHQLDLSLFSKRKREIITIIKKEGEIDLSTLAEKLHITKMATLKHIEGLESYGIVERVSKREGVGRPKLYLVLGSAAMQVFPKSYGNLSCSILHFLEEKYGTAAVREALMNRQDEVFAEHQEVLSAPKEFVDKIQAFAKIRDSQGYMIELNIIDSAYAEFIENNCPVMSVAEEYSQMCEVEKAMIENILDVDVQVTHRVVNGEKMCRFLIKERPKS